eukprot:9089780-Alexandrium_andersonii.AAC.1
MEYAVPGTSATVTCRYSFADADSPVWAINGRPEARFPLGPWPGASLCRPCILSLPWREAGR